MAKLAQRIPVGADEESVRTECLVLRAEKLSVSDSVESFWVNNVFSPTFGGEALKYPNLTKLVKASFALAHSNASVEREFSESGNVLEENRTSMALRTLNVRLDSRDGLRRRGGEAHLVPITSKLLRLAKSAYASYQLFLEEKGKRENEELQRKGEEKALLKTKETELALKRKNVDEMEASLKRLSSEKDAQSRATSVLLRTTQVKLGLAVRIVMLMCAFTS